MKLQFDDRIISERLLDHTFIKEDPENTGQFLVLTSFNGENITLKDGLTDKAAARTWLAAMATKIDESDSDIVDVR